MKFIVKAAMITRQAGHPWLCPFSTYDTPPLGPLISQKLGIGAAAFVPAMAKHREGPPSAAVADM